MIRSKTEKIPLDRSELVSEKGKQSRLIIADGHALVLDLLQVLLNQEFELVGAASNGSDLVSLARERQADLILLDVGMPGLSGLEAGSVLRAAGVDASLVYLSVENDPEVAALALNLGASAYLSKSIPATELLRVLRLVAAGGRYLAPSICGGDIAALCTTPVANPVGRLTARELEVLKLLVTGMPMKAVARALGIVPRTVAFHKYRAMEALGLHGNADLIDFAVRQGLLGGKHPGSLSEFRRLAVPR